MKVVQIGVGGWGKNHSRVLSEFGVLSAVCDANSERAEEFGKKYSVNFYNSFENLLDQEEFDAALVCTPTITHSDIATKLIENKKHVFIEKPMTYLSDDGQNLVDLAKRNNVILTCGYIERFNPAVASVKNSLKSQKYGDLIRLEFYREHRMPQHIKDVGVIYDTSVHDIDTAMWLFDDTPEVVFAIAGKINHEHEAFATITLGFKDNKTATISSNCLQAGGSCGCVTAVAFAFSVLLNLQSSSEIEARPIKRVPCVACLGSCFCKASSAQRRHGNSPSTF